MGTSEFNAEVTPPTDKHSIQEGRSTLSRFMWDKLWHDIMPLGSNVDFIFINPDIYKKTLNYSYLRNCLSLALTFPVATLYLTSCITLPVLTVQPSPFAFYLGKPQ